MHNQFLHDALGLLHLMGHATHYCVLPHVIPVLQASVNLATETALVRMLVPKGSVKEAGEKLAQVRQYAGA